MRRSLQEDSKSDNLLQLLVRESGGDGREVWVHEDVVDPHLVAAYFKKEVEAR